MSPENGMTDDSANIDGNASIMEALKTATAEQHRDAERRRLQQDMVRGVLPAAVYTAWLGQMYLIHEALYAAIESRADDVSGLAAIVRDEGVHVANLAADLHLLGIRTESVEPLPATARVLAAIDAMAETDPLSLLGYNYVLEGSMNGNRYIARALLGSLDVPAVSYLDPYGEEQRPVWLSYRERMIGADFDGAQGERMIAAARDMFSFIADLSDELIEDGGPA